MYADILILATLRNKPQHGYEMKKHIEQYLGGTLSLNNKVLYPALRHFEEMGAVQREVERQEGKPDRHIYALTERGEELLQALLRDFSPNLAENNAEFLVRVAFFDLLQTEEQREILTTRANVVARKLAHMRDLKSMANNKRATNYAWQVLQFHEQQIQAELAWIHNLIEQTEEK